MFGFLNVFKPKGMTSHDVVSVLRKVTKIKQIGHAGTLDPFAEGILPIAVGKATRLLEYFAGQKAYIATVQFGSSTTTYDTEGEVVNTSDKNITFEDVEAVLSDFRGEIEQIPPIYSAIKINGKKLYEYARQGEQIEIPPRKVYIYRLDILSFNETDKTFELYVECSKGTYIRSLAHDLGKRLKTYGHLSKLTRVKAGKFIIGNSIKLEDFKTLADIEQNLINPVEIIDLPKYELSEKDAEKISHGIKIALNISDGKFIFISKNKFIAVATVENGIAIAEKVFV